MATRMQQRRGTAAQWTAANPVLAAGEIGFETDTNKFKVGNGSTAWSSLTYFVDGSIAFDSAEVTAAINSAIDAVIDAAPNTLNTLNELAAAIGDNPTYALEIQNNFNTIHDTLDEIGNTFTVVDGQINALSTSLDTQVNALSSHIINNVAAHAEVTSNVHGIGNTLAIAFKSDVTSEINSAVSAHEADTSNVHGIANTAALVVTSDSRLSDERTPTDGSVTEAKLASNAVTSGKIANDAIDGSKIADDAVASEHIADQAISNAQISNTAAIAQSKISNLTSDLASKQDKISGVSDTEIGYLDGVTSNVQAQINAKAPSASPTFTGTVVLPSDTSVGNVSSTELGYLDGVTSNVQAQLNAKAALSGASFTGSISTTGDLTVDGNFTVNGSNVLVSASQIQVEDTLLQLGHTNSGNTTDLGLFASYNDGTQKHSGLVKDVSDSGKWKLFDGVTTEPGTTVNFAQGSLDTLVVGALETTTLTVGNVSNTELGYLDGVTSNVQAQINTKAPTASPTFTGLVSVAANGIAFTDGTQSKEGVPSRTAITSVTDTYNLSTGGLALRDGLIECNKASGFTVTIPTNSTTAFPVGTSIDILQVGAGQVTIAGDTGVTVNATPGLKLRTQWSSATLFKRATDTWVVLGDLSA